MKHTVNGRLHVEFTAKECDIPADERTRMQTLLAPLEEAVDDFPTADLAVHVLRHPRSDYHLEFKLKLPGATLFTGEGNEFLDTAYERGLRKLVRKVEAYKEQPNGQATKAAEQRLAFERELVAPEDPEAGPLGEAVRAGNYRAFRTALASYEDWLRVRAGRWVQRYPQAQAQIGQGLLIGDLVEEIYLNAFERYPQRSMNVPLSQWLESLIDPSLKALLQHPDRESENAALVRTLREAPLR